MTIWVLSIIICLLIFLIKLQRTELYRHVDTIDSLQRNVTALQRNVDSGKIKYIAKEQQSEEYQKLFKNAMEEVKLAEKELDRINKDKS